MAERARLAMASALAIAAAASCRSWSPGAHQPSSDPPPGVGSISAAQRSPLVATLTRHHLRITDRMRGIAVAELAVDQDGSRMVAITADGSRVALGAFGGSVSTFALGSDLQLSQVGASPPRAGLVAIAWTPDGSRLVAAHEDGSVLVWPGGDPSRPPLTLPNDRRRIESIALRPEGLHLVIGYQDGLETWDLEPFRLRDQLQSMKGRVAVSRSGTLVALGSETVVREPGGSPRPLEPGCIDAAWIGERLACLTDAESLRLCDVGGACDSLAIGGQLVGAQLLEPHGADLLVVGQGPRLLVVATDQSLRQVFIDGVVDRRPSP